MNGHPCSHPDVWFSRSIELCSHGVEGMHYFCVPCGECMDGHGKETELRPSLSWGDALLKINEQSSTIRQQAEAIEKLREALVPFARESDEWTPNAPDSSKLYGKLAGYSGAEGVIDQMETTLLRLGDLRKAKRVLASTDPNGKEK